MKPSRQDKVHACDDRLDLGGGAQPGLIDECRNDDSLHVLSTQDHIDLGEHEFELGRSDLSDALREKGPNPKPTGTPA